MTRAQILAEGEVLLRKAGLEGVSIESVMRAAGLTVGGFYAHFDSKQALLAELLSGAFDSARAVLLEGLEGVKGRPFVQAIAKRYLNRAHRDYVTSGCPGPATLSELANGGELPRQAMTRSIERHIASLLPGMPGADTREKRQQAIALLGLCMGGLALARAVDDRGLSDEIVRACRNIASKIGEDESSS